MIIKNMNTGTETKYKVKKDDLSTSIYYLNKLLSLLEKKAPKVYFRNDLILEIDDFIKDFENK